MEITRGMRALAGLIHGAEPLWSQDNRDRLLSQEQSSVLLDLARGCHAPTSTTPPWLTHAHGGARAGGADEHMATPVQAITTHVRLSDEHAAALLTIDQDSCGVRDMPLC